MSVAASMVTACCSKLAISMVQLPSKSLVTMYTALSLVSICAQHSALHMLNLAWQLATSSCLLSCI